MNNRKMCKSLMTMHKQIDGQKVNPRTNHLVKKDMLTFLSRQVRRRKGALQSLPEVK